MMSFFFYHIVMTEISLVVFYTPLWNYGLLFLYLEKWPIKKKSIINRTTVLHNYTVLFFSYSTLDYFFMLKDKY